MKKYLITGAMALLAGFYLTSCTHDDIEYSSLYEEKTQSFEKVFKDLYGTIDPNHDWGFTPYVVDNNTTEATAGTRGTRALTRGAYPNANMWAGEGWNVPDPLHADQIAIVRKYFQQFRDPVDEPINYSDFFVQDVYKGGTNLEGSKTTEAYYAAYGDPNSPFFGSNQMDQLSAGMGDHISNYNNAQCSPNTNVSSANPDLNPHTDKIMLMTGSSTAYFGYNNSLQSSYKYNDMFTRVSGNTIMQWARDNNITVPSTGDVTGMHFVGFDYEADLSHGLTDNMQGNSYLVTEVPAGTAGAFQIPNKQNDGDWQKGKWYIAGARDHYYSDWIVRIIPGTKRDTSDDQEKEEEETTTSNKYTAKRHVIVAMGRVFVEDLYNASRADIDYNDAVFDAIIWKDDSILVERNSQGRETITRIGENKYRVEIALLAAGGTIPMKIAGSKFGDVHQAFGVGLTTIVNTVGEASNVFGSLVTGKEYVYKEFDYTDELKSKNTISLNDIPIDVEWITGDVKVAARLNNKETHTYKKDAEGKLVVDANGNPIVEDAGAPVVPHVIQVPIGTAWAQERVNIGLANEGPYHKFPDYVSNHNVKFWESDVDNFYLYLGNRSPLAYSDKWQGYSYLTDIKDIVWAGSRDLSLLSSLFTLNLAIPNSGVREGQVMTFTFEDSNNSGSFQAQSLEVFSRPTTYYDGNVSSKSISITLTSEQASKINSQKQIRVWGRNLTLTSITIQ